MSETVREEWQRRRRSLFQLATGRKPYSTLSEDATASPLLKGPLSLALRVQCTPMEPSRYDATRRGAAGNDERREEEEKAEGDLPEFPRPDFPPSNAVRPAWTPAHKCTHARTYARLAYARTIGARTHDWRN